MTFIAGCLYQKTIYIIADSAETATIDLISPQTKLETVYKSTFQEVVHFGDGFLVAESANKISNIDNKLIATFAGNVYEGRETLKEIASEYKNYDSISEFLDSFFASKEIKETEYIIAYYENELPHLHFFLEGEYKHYSGNDVVLVICGSNADGISEIFQKSIDHAATRKYTNEEMLMQSIASLQSYSLNQLLIKKGIGGHFNGLLISKEGIKWAPDTITVLYSGYNPDAEMFVNRKYNRDNATFIATNETRVLFNNEFNRYSLDELRDKWMQEMDCLDKTLICNYYVFISYDTKVLLLLSNHESKKNRVAIHDNKIILDEDSTSWLGQRLVSPTGELLYALNNNFEPGGIYPIPDEMKASASKE